LALRTFEQRGIFIVPHLLWHGTSFFSVSSKGPPQSAALTTHEGMWRMLSILTRTLTGLRTLKK
jgi:hypothetical protein